MATDLITSDDLRVAIKNLMDLRRMKGTELHRQMEESMGASAPKLNTLYDHLKVGNGEIPFDEVQAVAAALDMTVQELMDTAVEAAKFRRGIVGGGADPSEPVGREGLTGNTSDLGFSPDSCFGKSADQKAA